MAKGERITVTAKIDGGNHAVYGRIKKDQQYTIDEAHFADELFERPEGFKSSLEIQDDERRKAKQTPVADAPAGKGSKKSKPDETV